MYMYMYNMYTVNALISIFCVPANVAVTYHNLTSYSMYTYMYMYLHK